MSSAGGGVPRARARPPGDPDGVSLSERAASSGLARASQCEILIIHQLTTCRLRSCLQHPDAFVVGFRLVVVGREGRCAQNGVIVMTVTVAVYRVEADYSA